MFGLRLGIDVLLLVVVRVRMAMLLLLRRGSGVVGMYGNNRIATTAALPW